MSIEYALVANGETVLTQVSAAQQEDGNFGEVAAAVLARLAADAEPTAQQSTAQGSSAQPKHKRHTFLLRNEYAAHVCTAPPLAFVCVCARAFSAASAFAFLDTVRVRFWALYGFAPAGATLSLESHFTPIFAGALASACMRSPLTEAPLDTHAASTATRTVAVEGESRRSYSEGGTEGLAIGEEREFQDVRVQLLKEKAEEVMEQMRENIDVLQERGQKVEALEEKARLLDEQSSLLPEESRRLKHRKRCEYMRCWMWIIVGVVLLLLLAAAAYGVAFAVCGDALLEGCWNPNHGNGTSGGNSTQPNATLTDGERLLMANTLFWVVVDDRDAAQEQPWESES
jgi:Synaptobrevin/Regulated-SNARE-like domain